MLHAGPVPAGSRSELLAARARFLAAAGFGDEASLLDAFERRDARLLDALGDGDHVVLWFEHDLYDQLQLLDVLALTGEAGSPELIVIGAFPGRPSFAGLGELGAEELRSLWPERRPAMPALHEAASAAWDAVRRPEPAGLRDWALRETPELPFLAAALRRFLEELPAPADGLSTTERHALRAVAEGASTPAAAFVSAQRMEAAPFLGDTWFYRALSELRSGPEPLLEETAGGLGVTPAGERVLAGEADRVELLGLDRWVGGTHVTREDLWRWDPGAQTLHRS